MIKLAINGFGRIGRTAFKAWYDLHRKEIDVVAINDLVDSETLAHLLKYDTNYGIWDKDVSGENTIADIKNAKDGENVGKIKIGELEVPTFATKDPSKLPWGELMVNVVIESTGKFTGEEGMNKHIEAGAGKVILSAPAKEGAVNTYLIGVNDDKYNGEKLINNASCTTNCIAPVAAIMQAKFGVLKAMMTTIHGYTQDQNLQDGPHRDLRRARAAALNIVPTSTGAAIATTKVIKELAGLFDGSSIRVPVPVGSISDFTFLLAKKVTAQEINGAFKEAADSERYKGILSVTDKPIVSHDIVGRTESSIVDLSLTQVVDGDMVKVFAWYDNEFGYSHRLIEQVIKIGR